MPIERTHAHPFPEWGIGRGTILERVGDNRYIAEYNGVKCSAIYNPFVNRFYVDDKYGVIQDHPQKSARAHVR